MPVVSTLTIYYIHIIIATTIYTLLLLLLLSIEYTKIQSSYYEYIIYHCLLCESFFQNCLPPGTSINSPSGGQPRQNKKNTHFNSSFSLFFSSSFARPPPSKLRFFATHNRSDSLARCLCLQANEKFGGIFPITHFPWSQPERQSDCP